MEINNIAYFISLTDRWRNEGATWQEVHDELDMRILKTGHLVFKQFMDSKGIFILNKFRSLALRYSWQILTRYKHLPSVGFDIPSDKKYLEELEKELCKWKVEDGISKNDCYKSVATMNLFAEIQIAGVPFIVK